MENALQSLSLDGLIDESGHWAGGTGTLIQTGDIVDRGPDSLALLALFERLQAEAAEAGGELILLLGNHEVRNLRPRQLWPNPEA
jgi:hypothetical protein